jgi:polyadenylation factor subunit 2
MAYDPRGERDHGGQGRGGGGRDGGYEGLPFRGRGKRTSAP